MRLGVVAAALFGLWLCWLPAHASPRTHTVSAGQTLGAIARRYNVSIQALCEANHITRRDKLRPGQELVIPQGNEEEGDDAKQNAAPTADRKTHRVSPGQTLGRIARRYNVSIEQLCGANGIRRNAALKPGTDLVIPDPHDPDPRPEGAGPATAAQDRPGDRAPASPGGVQELTISGSPVYYYEPVGSGRASLRPVLFFLHGRGGDAASDCRRWAPIARAMGWLVCPSGPVIYGGGRSWGNNWIAGQNLVMAALQQLRAKYGRRVQLYGNTLIGFSEGAHVAMNVGVRNPKTFNRWLILGASDAYWGGQGLEALQAGRGALKRVYLITGEQDEVVERTRTVAEWLQHARVVIRVTTPEDLAHELALETKAGLYRTALMWLDRGMTRPPIPPRHASASDVRR
jgi:LysM repeat protein/predicted esterase